MKPLISLIIPVYNVAKYLPRCLDSVLAQTYKNWEGILVDDGSTDSSGKICDEYADKDDRFLVFHKTNGGLSDARNYGVSRAKADLVSFFDSDDYVEDDYLEYLWKLMEQNKVDISCGGSLILYDEEKPKKQQTKIEEVVLTAEQAVERMAWTSVCADAKLYKKDLLLAHPFPVGRLYEDLATTCKIVGSARKIAFSNKTIGYWCMREGSITNSKIDHNQYDLFYALDEFGKYIQKEYPDIINAVSIRNLMAITNFMSRLFSHPIEDEKIHFKAARSRLMPYVWQAVFDKRSSLKCKIAGVAIAMGYHPSKITWTIKMFLEKKR